MPTLPRTVTVACPECGHPQTLTLDLAAPGSFWVYPCTKPGCRVLFSISFAFDVAKYPPKENTRGDFRPLRIAE